MSRQSQGYDAASDRSLADQGAVVVEQSDATAAQLRALMSGLSTQTHQGLQLGLDTAVQQTATESARSSDMDRARSAKTVAKLSPTTPPGVERAAISARADSLAVCWTAVSSPSWRP